ncbi:MAG: LamG-like jellyroll fold domain-containing protein [Bryobacteraceae bacterium]
MTTTLLLGWLGLAASACPGAQLVPTPDYLFLRARLSGPVAWYRWVRNDHPGEVAPDLQLFLLGADGDLVGWPGIQPLEAQGVSYVEGRWGLAVGLEPGGRLSYPSAGHLDLREGTLEMWVALRQRPEDQVYQRDHVLFQYRARNGDTLQVAQSGRAGTLYAGGTVRGQWQSAWGASASMRDWEPGEWHHIACTWSATENRIKFYVDGVQTADTNEKHYWAPEDSGDRFSLGASLTGADAAYWLDEVRILARALDAAEIRALAGRQEPVRGNEIWLSLGGASQGDRFRLEFDGCASAEYTFPGIPLSDPDPPSTLLPAGATELDLSLRSMVPTRCAWSVGEPLQFPQMHPFDSGAGGTLHRTRVRGLSPDTTQVNDVYVRCQSHADYALHLRYRALPDVNPSFPRKGNLWGWRNLAAKGLEYASRIDLYLGAGFTPAQIRRLRRLNPNILILTSINVVENRDLPDDYYLKDTTGSRIEVWPGTYRLNLTKPYVAEYQARYAYQRILDSGLMVDGCFFDNFFTSQSWLRADIHGRKVELDADEDGKPDDPAWLDAAWRDGVYHELRLWRKWMPYALASGHLPRPPQPEFAGIFNGDSIGFMTADVIEGKRSFDDLWQAYHRWWEIELRLVITMVESAPPDQIAYGYGYRPFQTMPPATLEFARDFYPYMRFGLAFTLMNDGYFTHEFGDISHGQDWWYDELDYDLGYPLGPPRRIPVEGFESRNQIINGGFEEPLEGSWRLTLNSAVGAAATLSRDTSEAAVGAASARITITGPGTDYWHVDFNQRDRTFVAGQSYDLSFWAKASSPRTIGLSTQKGSPDWRNYGLSRQIEITTEWRHYTVTFEARETASDSRLQFFLGKQPGTVWIDEVELSEHPPDLFRRDFTRGVVLLNATPQPQRIRLEPGLRRLRGEQAPRYEYIVDDAGEGFRVTGTARATVFDSGEWKSTGPYYHDWGPGCHILEGQDSVAEWELQLRADDVYSIYTWWPAAPEAARWTSKAVFEILAGGQVLASVTLDQTSSGDQWNLIATLPLARADRPVVRLRNAGEGPAIADALLVRSAARYNDGSPALEVELEPMDGILLARNPAPGP